MFRWQRLAAAFAVTLIPGAAFAQDAYTTTDLNMRAGPNTGFPIVTTIPDNRGVNIHGCINGYEWCDVSWRGRRGWVYAAYLTYPYSGSRVPVIEYGRRINLPIVTFGFTSYWDRHYRGEPWYRNRDRWRRRFHSEPPWGYYRDRGRRDRGRAVERERRRRDAAREWRQRNQRDVRDRRGSRRIEDRQRRRRAEPQRSRRNTGAEQRRRNRGSSGAAFRQNRQGGGASVRKPRNRSQVQRPAARSRSSDAPKKRGNIRVQRGNNRLR